VPGKYQGLLAISVTGPSEIVAPSDIPYEIVVEASPWEKSRTNCDTNLPAARLDLCALVIFLDAHFAPLING